MEGIKRQGDMEIVRVTKAEVEKLKSIVKQSTLTVGVGEVSGHSHLVRPIDGARIVEYAVETEELVQEDIFSDREEIFFEVTGGRAVILHEEHGPQILEEGFYKRVNQLNYNPFQKRLEKVRD